MKTLLKWGFVVVVGVLLLGCAGIEKRVENLEKETANKVDNVEVERFAEKIGEELRKKADSIEVQIWKRQVEDALVGKADATDVAVLKTKTEDHETRIATLEAWRKEVDSLLKIRQSHFRGLKDEVLKMMEHLNFGKNRGVVGTEIHPFPSGKTSLEDVFKARPDIKKMLEEVKKAIADGKSEVLSVVAFEDMGKCKPSAPPECKVAAKLRGLEVAKFLGVSAARVTVRPPTNQWGNAADNRRVVIFRLVKA